MGGQAAGPLADGRPAIMSADAVGAGGVDPLEIQRFKEQHLFRPAPRAPWWRIGLGVEVLLILLLWEIAVSVLGLVRASFLPPPTAVAASFADLITGRNFLAELFYSVSNLAVGMVLATVVGIGAGVAIGWSRVVGILAGPLVWALYSTPKIALTPLIILWLGIGPPSKVLLVFLLAVFPVLLNTAEGVRTVDPSIVRAGRVFGASSTRLARKVILPATLPFVLVGLRRAIALGFIGEIMGEFIGGAHGIGHLLQIAVYGFRMDDALAIVLIMVVVANAGLIALDVALRRLAPWHAEGPVALS